MDVLAAHPTTVGVVVFTVAVAFLLLVRALLRTNATVNRLLHEHELRAVAAARVLADTDTDLMPAHRRTFGDPL